jgi:hypothetical protein
MLSAARAAQIPDAIHKNDSLRTQGYYLSGGDRRVERKMELMM